MDRTAITGLNTRIRIAALNFSHGLRLRHSRRDSEVQCIAARVGTVLRLGKTLRNQGILVRLRSVAAGWF